MFDVFKNMGALAGLMRNLPKLQEQMELFQRKLGEITAEGDAGAGMVKVKGNGRMEILSVTISEEGAKDRELLEDLIRAAVNQALLKAKALVGEETSKMASETFRRLACPRMRIGCSTSRIQTPTRIPRCSSTLLPTSCIKPSDASSRSGSPRRSAA